ncbi:hypothetical protein, partial [Streptomyces sp. NPDC057284]|uniref:hypothetical protein n=1 Tax=Streptomyces sp. NPDC057284 TaxID=3346083 RepID=UPI00363F47B7
HVLAPGARFPAVARPGILPPPAGKVLPDGTYLSELRGRGTSERMPVRVIEYTTTLGPDGAVEETSEGFCLIAYVARPRARPGRRACRAVRRPLDQRNDLQEHQDRAARQAHCDLALEQPRPG